MVTPTRRRNLERKKEKERKSKISREVTAKQRSETSVHAKDPVREELRQREIKKGGEFAKDVEQKEIEAVARRSFKIGEEKTRLGEEKVREENQERIKQEEIEGRPVGQEAIEADLAERGIIPGIQQAQNEFLMRSQGLKPLEEMALYQQLLLQIAATGGTPLPGQFAAGSQVGIVGRNKAAQNLALFGSQKNPTVVQIAQQIGRSPKIHPSIAAQYATNGKSTTKTASWLIGLGIGVAVTSGILGIVGTYPFGGFIKEEALQTLSFGTKNAKDSGNLELEERAIIETEELLDPTLWQRFINKIPFANIQQNLNAFFRAAATKVKIDRESFEKRRGKI